MKSKEEIQQMTNEQLLDAFSDEAFDHGAETELEHELRNEILRRMGNGKRPKAEIHCICGAYRMARRDTAVEAEQAVEDWYTEHLVEFPELDHARTDKATANQAREFIGMA